MVLCSVVVMFCDEFFLSCVSLVLLRASVSVLHTVDLFKEKWPVVKETAAVFLTPFRFMCFRRMYLEIMVPLKYC